MDKELCFIFEEKQLYMEQILVEYDEVPLFYICSSESEYYVVLRRNFDEESYVVVKTTIKQIVDVLQGTLTMRDIILKQKMFWDIVAGEDVEDDIITCRDMKDVPINDLPYEDSYFQIACKEHEVFMKKLTQYLFEESNWDKVGELSVQQITDIFEEEKISMDIMPLVRMEVSNVEWSWESSVVSDEKMQLCSIENYDDILCEESININNQKKLQEYKEVFADAA